MPWCFGGESEEEVAAREKSKAIDRGLKDDAKRLKMQVKLLLLGAGASGKSTFVRQMRIIHGKGFSEEERQFMRVIVYDNVTVSIQTLIAGMQHLNIPYETDHRKQLAARLSNVQVEQVTTPEEFGGISGWVSELWQDSGVQACYERRSELDLLDSCHYYLKDIERLSTNDYLPSDDDITHCRSPTVSILEYDFYLDTVLYRIVDVGGQEAERRKWLSCFEGVTSVVFLAALSEYSQTVQEGGKTCNSLMASVALLAQVMRSKYLFQSSFILFLNKNDVFEERILKRNVQDYLPSYSGPPHNADAAYAFLEETFMSAVPQQRRQQHEEAMANDDNDDEPLIYCHRTTATDTDNIRRIFNAVKDTILELSLVKWNLA